MQDVRACAREYGQLFVVDVDAMRKRDVWRSEADRVQVSNVALTCCALNQLNLDAILRCMCVHQHAALACKLGNTFEQRACATDGEARREAITNPAVRTSVPLFEQRERCTDRVFGLFMQSGGYVRACIHHAL